MEHAWLAGMPTITPQGCGHPPKELASPCTGESVPPDDSIKFNDRDNRVAAIDFPLSKTTAPRLRFIAWFRTFSATKIWTIVAISYPICREVAIALVHLHRPT
jgi:hypothetical protein